MYWKLSYQCKVWTLEYKRDEFAKSFCKTEKKATSLCSRTYLKLKRVDRVLADIFPCFCFVDMIQE